MTTIEPAICSICISPLGETNRCTLECGHSFHYNCVFQWNRQNHSCPLCRDEVNINPPEETDNTNTHFRDIVQNSNQHGFKVFCKECDTFLVECEDCGKKMCNCVIHTGSIESDFYNSRNPFSQNLDNDNDSQTCYKCFLNRDFNVLEHVLELRNDDSYLESRGYTTIYDDPYVKEKYETYFTNQSGNVYTTENYGEHYREYRDYESFVSHIEMLCDHEIYNENWNIIPIEENINEYINDFETNSPTRNFEDIYNHLFMNIPNIPNISNTNTTNIIQTQFNQLFPTHQQP